MTEEEIKSHMEPSQYIGRCPEQVHAFTAKCRALCKNAEAAPRKSRFKTVLDSLLVFL